MRKEYAREHGAHVVIVGAGPVGLLAGICATRLGLEVDVLDENRRPQTRGHATILHASSLRLLEELGLAEPMVTSGHRIERIGLYVDGIRSAALELPSPVLAVPQSTLEQVLGTALREDGVEILPARQATTLTESDGRVHVRVVRFEGDRDGVLHPTSSSVLETDFVIGADGRGSRVRAALGIDIVEVGAPVSYAMFELPSDDPGSEMILAFSEGLASAMIPLPGGRVRWGFQLESGSTQKLYASDLCAFLAERAPWYRQAVERVDWASVVRFERRVARHFGKSRAWLAGDAAHGTSPFGAQSMNVGLCEARELVRGIARCVESGGAPGELESYGEEQRREWHKLLGVNVSFELLPGARPWLAAYARRIVPALPASDGELEVLLRQMGLVLR